MTIAGDLRYALRGIRLRPGWSAAIVLTLALGIGANATMFSVVDRLLVRAPAHVADPGRAVRVELDYSDRRGGRFTMESTSWPVFTDLERSTHSFAAMATVSGGEMVLGTGADASSIQGAKVSGEYFTLLGPRPLLGRFFGPAEDRPPVGEPVAVLSNVALRAE